MSHTQSINNVMNRIVTSAPPVATVSGGAVGMDPTDTPGGDAIMATIKQRTPASQSTDTSTRGDPVVTRVGNLTADPELRVGESSGRPYARMRIAVSTPKVEGDWSGERETSFYHVTAFGSLAENVANCLRKGTRVVVTGRGEVRNWTGDDGTEYESEGILADAIGPDLRWATAAVTKTAWPGARGSAQSTRDPRSM